MASAATWREPRCELRICATRRRHARQSLELAAAAHLLHIVRSSVGVAVLLLPRLGGRVAASAPGLGFCAELFVVAHAALMAGRTAICLLDELSRRLPGGARHLSGVPWPPRHRGGLKSRLGGQRPAPSLCLDGCSGG